ncbi:MAG: DUF6122 family protein [Bacteroidota bacterium]
MLRPLIHYGIHFLLPLLIVFSFKQGRLQVALLLFAGLLIDIDHLWATPIFDANRCSIGFHPLHSYGAIALYGLLFAFKKTRLLGLGLLIHILADSADCYMISLQP